IDSGGSPSRRSSSSGTSSSSSRSSYACYAWGPRSRPPTGQSEARLLACPPAAPTLPRPGSNAAGGGCAGDAPGSGQGLLVESSGGYPTRTPLGELTGPIETGDAGPGPGAASLSVDEGDSTSDISTVSRPRTAAPA